jgi:uncharacterized membrane protein YjfL (UPF0719 family)
MDQTAMMSFLNEVIRTVAWALVGALSMGISLGLLIKFFDWMTPVNEWNQIKNGNIAMGLVLASVILAFGFVIACTLIPTEFNVRIITEAAKAAVG